MNVGSIGRTATLAWSPNAREPLLATGTVAGALDDSFSQDSVLELWEPFAAPSEDDLGIPQPRAKITTQSRFHALAWGQGTANAELKSGAIAGGLENGCLQVWNAAKALRGEEATIFKTDKHKGAVKGLDFNKLQTQLFASGAADGEIFIWDLNTPNKPYSPGTRSRNLEDITSLAWNRKVASVLATASSSGHTVVWDLRTKREVVTLSYNGMNAMQQGGPAGNMFAPNQSFYGMGQSGARGVSAVVWHPDNPTRLTTGCEDDMSPVILTWDLRNWKTPEKVLVGHEKGVLGLDWCAQDSNLLLSCGKDCRTLAWNPVSGEIVGETPASSNWSFATKFCPRNPDLVATASFDGKIELHSLQATRKADSQPTTISESDGADIFDPNNISTLAAQAHPGVSLKQPPKWLKRPITASFGYGGKLVTFNSLATTVPPANNAQGPPSATQPSGPAGTTIKIHQIATEEGIIERAKKLEQAQEAGSLSAFCEERREQIASSASSAANKKVVEDEVAAWKLLSSLFRADSRDELVTLLGFSKEQVKETVEQAIAKYKSATGNIPDLSIASSDDGRKEPAVTFAEGISSREDDQESFAAHRGDDGASVSAVSESTTTTSKTVGADTAFTEPSLFGDDNAAGLNLGGNHDDFYSSLRASNRPNALPDHLLAAGRATSSVAATMGSRASSVASESIKATTFKIYPHDESESDRLITRALVLGDFHSAVSLCLSSDRLADALLLAIRGGPTLLAATQKAYFERRTTSLPYLRLFQSIVSDDLADIVQNADLADWQDIFVVLCTFAKPDEFANLVEQLGQRLEYQYVVGRQASGDASKTDLRRQAVQCYLAAGKLEKVVGIWTEEMKEEEGSVTISDPSSTAKVASSRYAARANALQSFIEKVLVFQSAVKYVDQDLAQPTQSAEVADSGARTYKLAALYDRYLEYAEVLAAQGMLDSAVKFIKLIPTDYRAPNDHDASSASTRDRLTKASGKYTAVRKAPAAVNGYGRQQAYPAIQKPAYPPTMPQASPYGMPQQLPAAAPMPAYNSPYQPAAVQTQPAAPQNSYSPYGPPSNAPSAYAPQTATQSPYAPYGQQQQAQPSFAPPPVNQSSYNAYSNAPQQQTGPGSSFLPAPPRPITSSPSIPQAPQPSSIAPPPKRAEGGWNDAPKLDAIKRTASAASHRATPAPAAITSPFPMAPGAPAPNQGYPSNTGMQNPYGQPPQNQGMPPQAMPPHSMPPPAAGGNVAPPPPRGANRTPSQSMQQQPRPMSTISPPPQTHSMGSRQGSLSGQMASMAQPQPDPYSPQIHQPATMQSGYSPVSPRVPSQQGQFGQPPMQNQAPSGPYAPPPSQSQPGPYAPPQQAQTGPYAPPPQQQGQGGPPPMQRPTSQMGMPPPQQGANPQMQPQQQVGMGMPPPQQRLASDMPAPARVASPAPAKPEPPKPKYPPGDRTHISEAHKPIHAVLLGECQRFKQTAPPQFKKMADDTEKRMNVLFDGLNCGTVAEDVVSQLLEIIQAIQQHNKARAAELHLQLLTSTTTNDKPWLPALKQLINMVRQG